MYCVDVQGLSSSLLESNLVTLLSDQRIINIILQVRGGGFGVWQMMHPASMELHHYCVQICCTVGGLPATHASCCLNPNSQMPVGSTDRPTLQPSVAAACTPDCCRVRS